MKVKVFYQRWDNDNQHLEDEVNKYLAALPPHSTVKHVNTTAAGTRTRDTDQMETHTVVTVWYDD